MWATTARMLSWAGTALALLAGCAVLPQRSLLSAAERPDLPARADIRAVENEDEDATGLAKWSPKRVAGKVKQAAGFGPDQQKAQERFQEAEVEFQAAVALRRQGDAAGSREKFVAAAEEYWSASKLWPDSSLHEDAMFWAGEGYFFADRYPQATKAYSALIKKYPSTRHLDTVTARQFGLADYWLDLHDTNPDWPVTPNLTDRRRPRFDTFGNALKVFDRIRFDDPTGRLSDDATMAAANANFAAGKYARADTLYADLRDSFPDSEHQFNAHLLGLKCKMLCYEGPDYDGTVLNEAEDLVKRMFRLFPDEAEKHRQNLETALREVRLKKATREWVRAKYYDRRNEYGSARYYYEIVQRDFHDTNLAQEAQHRLAQIGGLPSQPPQRLAWLADLFPESKQTKPLIARNSVDAKCR